MELVILVAGVWLGYLMPVVAIARLHTFWWGVGAFVLPLLLLKKPFGCFWNVALWLFWAYHSLVAGYVVYGLWIIGMVIVWLFILAILVESHKRVAQAEKRAKELKGKVVKI